MKVPNFTLSVLGRKMAFSTLVQYAGKIAQLVLSAVALKIISNYLSAEGYGVYATITEFALFFSVVANLGIFGNVVRVMADRPDDGDFFMNALVLRVVTGLLIFGVAVLVASGLGVGPDGVPSSSFVFGTALFCGALFFDFVTSVCDGMLQANYLMGRATFALVCGRVVNVAMLLVVTRYAGAAVDGGGFTQGAVLGATLLGSLVSCGLSLFFVARKITLRLRVTWPTILKIFEVSLPFGIIILINNLYFRFIPDYLANHFLSGASFGSFNIYFRISQVLSLASTFLMFSALPGLTEYIDSGHHDKALKLYKILQRLCWVAGGFLVVAGSLVGPYAVAILTHAKYNLPELWFVLPLMLLLAAVSYGYDLVFLTLFAFGEELWFLKREFLALALGAVFFGLAYTDLDSSVKIVLILTGAIGAEALMVVLGSAKIKKIFAATGTRQQ